MIMKKVLLIPALELGNKLNVNVMDFPEGDPADPAKARKRCGITVDYSARDIKQLEEQGMDRSAMMEYYRKRIYDLVKLNIAQDWECTGGMEDVLAIVEKHLDR